MLAKRIYTMIGLLAITTVFLLYITRPHDTPDLWPTIAENIQINYQMGQQAAVDEQINWYAEHPKALQTLFNNAAPYLYYVYDEIQKRDLPAELALIPLVESGYNPFVQSSVGASGLWQMMPNTAGALGLQITADMDDRLNIQASTQSALDYFAALHGRFDNWLLAIAAYDAGAGRVHASLKKQSSHHMDFWSLSLPRESKQYVSKLIALATILKNPERFHVSLKPIANQPFFRTLTVEKKLNLNQVAHRTQSDLDTIRRLNPELTQHSTAFNGTYAILIPRTEKK